MTIDMLAFDADDTLWDNESRYLAGKQRFLELLSAYASPHEAGQRLDAAEVRNVPYFGYGVKSFTLSMLETAVDLSAGRFGGEGVREILAIAKGMLTAPLVVYERVPETLESLSGMHALMLITKGDPFEQEMKIAKTGLGQHFEHVEIVGEKSLDTYRKILQRYAIRPEGFFMVGNSVKSDILPVLKLGGRAAYIPQENTWFHEHTSEDPNGLPGYYTLEHIWQLPELLRNLDG
jgi:putative hydrolase of the HAD superfamily